MGAEVGLCTSSWERLVTSIVIWRANTETQARRRRAACVSRGRRRGGWRRRRKFSTGVHDAWRHSKRTKRTTSAGQTQATRQGLRGFLVSSESQFRTVTITFKAANPFTNSTDHYANSLWATTWVARASDRATYEVLSKRRITHRNSHYEEAASHNRRHTATYDAVPSQKPIWARAWEGRLPLLDVQPGVWFKGSQQCQLRRLPMGIGFCLCVRFRKLFGARWQLGLRARVVQWDANNLCAFKVRYG